MIKTETKEDAEKLALNLIRRKLKKGYVELSTKH